MPNNIILNTDSYKASHFNMYPPGCEALSCYIESRGGPFPTLVFFGLQAFLQEYLTTPITQNDIDEAEEILIAHGLPFNRAGWMYILTEHNGRLPVQIDAVEEGSCVPAKQVLLQITNTDPACFWLPAYLETALLRGVWYPTTVATVSWSCKQILHDFLSETADSLEFLPFMLHDFGARGVSSKESAALGGLAHLVSFQGTDTLNAVIAGRKYYNEPMAGFSIPAAEHSTIISWGRQSEAKAYQHIIENNSGEGCCVAIVCDSYNIWQALDEIFSVELRELIQKNKGRLVIRPDSGNPEEVVLTVVESLMKHFGSCKNQKGYRVLPNNLRVIQGDGVNRESIQTCLEYLKNKKISAENVAFGMGGALLQRVHRDTAKFAMKASAVKINGQWKDVKKEPVTDLSKSSKSGRLALCKDNEGHYYTEQENTCTGKNYLLPVYKDGALLREDTLTTVRERANRWMNKGSKEK